MDFVSIRDLRTRSAAIWESLAEAKDLVVTSNGKPVAVLSAATPSTLDATLAALRQARAQLAVINMQRRAQEAGLDQWSLEEVNAEINEARRQRRK
ncbi:MAG: type II toxin-antitoxin system Phd/YefM family antitoxin [Acidobacteriota bacterium]|nr:type II toxin-antitoxin system Phd/YefM family antitoxin [Acidobacteriota bacterium]MXZ37548.1 type II toxin-antitoxin system Phd/YefM family antitoxin [Holophagales bacterium]MDE2921640.1 type II toxin-antitoxin system Phd/YefM family antitoxin [Acidobacteriota bacterium]MDE3266555.1 type II toxin-antitoxin system Phd/YefM family antitoxin [Acidobacteriota bacterium]MYF06054.1 type II toxin-antitoxin system Phd/YefM family antitoxin [Holophagales bacterium]